jgi:DNA-binding NtrC family response regulator
MGADRTVGAGAGPSSPLRSINDLRTLPLLARRLCREPAQALEGWRARCRACAELGEEDASYLEALERVAAPLVQALSDGRPELAELHAVELFQELRSLGLQTAATLQVIDCLHAACVELLGTGEHGSAIDELRRFLTRVAVDVAMAPATSALLSESNTRPSQRGGVVYELIGESSQTRRLRAELLDIACAPGAVLIVGESGTGKELVAQALHRLAHPSERALLAINCSALPRELIESELFGHERGAFTGSRESAPGLLRAAGEGTVFLDELTEMPEVLQPKLLRALEQRAVRPVGGIKEQPIHARIIAATNRDPESAVRRGQLRADLFYRICVHRIEVAPLRERLEDIPALITHFLGQLSARRHLAPRGFGQSSLERLLAHDWPGNVRELKNVVEHCCATAKGGEVELQHLPRHLQGPRTPARSGTFVCAEPIDLELPAPTAELAPLREIEKEHIGRALRAAGGNKTVAARLLGLSRHQLYVRLERLGLAG